MTPCVISLANADKRVADLEQTLSALIDQSPDDHPSFFRRLYFSIMRIPMDVRIFCHVISAQREFARDDKNFRALLQTCNCPPEVLTICWERFIPVVRGWEKVLEHAYKANFPSYVVTRIENCLHTATDFAEDLEIASDPECVSLFEELAGELAKRQK